MRFLRLTGIGFCVGTFFTCLFAGGVEEGFFLLFISIVCTAGMGLAVWVPLWWAIGWTVIAVVNRVSGRSSQPSTTDAPRASGGRTSPAKRSLQQYVRKADAKGVQREKADLLLQKMGWSPMEIEQARQQVSAAEFSDA
mgnify:FL=1